MPAVAKGGRWEKRVTRVIAVQLVSESQPLQSELAVTENISSRGARVRARWPRHPNEHLILQSLPGSFQSVARVAYCHRVAPEGFVIGLHFLEPTGDWILGAQPGPKAMRKLAQIG